MEDEDSPKIHPTVVRLRPELRAELQRLAYVSGRSLSKEIARRLEASLLLPPPGKSTATAQASTTYASQPVQALTTDDRPKESNTLNDHDRAVLALFRQLPPEKQLSLLTLLRP